MNPPTACRVCLGPLALMASGSDVAPRPESFAPTCHRPGAHGDLYRCRACGTVEQPSVPRGAALVIATPDPASLPARVAGSRWWGYIPAHFCLIPRATLRELVTARGLTIVAERPYVRSFTPAYWLNGLADRSAVVAAVGGLARRLPRRALLSMSLGDERVLVARSPAVAAARARGARRRSEVSRARG